MKSYCEDPGLVIFDAGCLYLLEERTYFQVPAIHKKMRLQDRMDLYVAQKTISFPPSFHTILTFLRLTFEFVFITIDIDLCFVYYFLKLYALSCEAASIDVFPYSLFCIRC
jgi:hypothetical protein